MDFGICKQRIDINLAGVRWEISACREGRMNQIREGKDNVSCN
ncbi:MAG: hypothetical protein E7A27_11940 [Erysipelotrichaceae bacterium]|jgi:hypothetical protein|nr:hypothetical protein [Erysipelotrichaceae bacterium]